MDAPLTHGGVACGQLGSVYTLAVSSWYSLTPPTNFSSPLVVFDVLVLRRGTWGPIANIIFRDQGDKISL
jgi:hypothetical protein